MFTLYLGSRRVVVVHGYKPVKGRSCLTTRTSFLAEEKTLGSRCTKTTVCPARESGCWGDVEEAQR